MIAPAAGDAFAAVLTATDPGSGNVLDAYSRALATAGNTVLTGAGTADARRAFEHATTLSTAPGLLAGARRQLDLIAASADQNAMSTRPSDPADPVGQFSAQLPCAEPARRRGSDPRNPRLRPTR